MADIVKLVELWAGDLGLLAILGAVVCLITQFVKLPFKALFKKVIKNANVLDRVNAVIILLPLGLGVLADFILSLFTEMAFDVVQGFIIGGMALAIYALLEKIFKGNMSKQTQSALELTKETLKDGKVDKADKSAVKEFLEKVK
jgi:hypothetical protein